MATINVTNTIAQSACAGQGVRVTMNYSDSLNLPSILIGQLASVSSSSKIGYISQVDYFGNSFLVTPQYPFSSFNSTNNPEGLLVSENITITT